MIYSLYHYYDANRGPFRNLSGLTADEAALLSRQLVQEGRTFASRRSEDYMSIRRGLEAQARAQFIAKGGQPRTAYPHYMTLGVCDWLKTWYENPCVLRLDWDDIREDAISFTYGDLFPTMRVQDRKPYRGQVYTKKEIVAVIEAYGFPQAWNANGEGGPERYIEAQIWDEEEIRRFYA
ncbi:hypothetical protein [Cohnella nanjingensis]|uniref:Uncharacterized protein n=1 Tax=Cohnella nanjingensis TaxID=1387779 RepID=A0A7X0VHN0_9BACL|nr:hypothetical protein [Cohnella nanjingensis]MBB6672819.1 hypothetical protein [Cohnella nanjingensis]